MSQQSVKVLLAQDNIRQSCVNQSPIDTCIQDTLSSKTLQHSKTQTHYAKHYMPRHAVKTPYRDVISRHLNKQKQNNWISRKQREQEMNKVNKRQTQKVENRNVSCIDSRNCFVPRNPIKIWDFASTPFTGFGFAIILEERRSQTLDSRLDTT